MTNKQKYDNAFAEALSIDISEVNDSLEYRGIDEWDSIGHIELVSKLEEAFDIALDTSDIVDLSSYKKGIEILAKYKVNI